MTSSVAARAATADELVKLRVNGDWTKAYLGIYVPNVIYTALLNGAPASTDMVGQISFDNGVGTLGDVKAEMTLWVGSVGSVGARDLGTCRIRKAPVAGTFYIGTTSEIDWVDDCVLTIVDHAMLSKKPILMDAGALKMDGETAYSDQHSVFDPVPVLLPSAAAWLTGASVDVPFDASDAWVFGSTISGYAWIAPGASASSGMTSAMPTITYNAAGYYRVYCTVTAANGKTATGVRFVMVFNAASPPHAVEIQAPYADYDKGGWEFDARMFADADPTAAIEGALCVLFAEDWYGATKQSIGQIANRENIICWGYIAGETIDWDAEASSVEFSVKGPNYWLDQIACDPLMLSMAANTPDSWEVMSALTVDRLLWHILHWRSNATALLDVTLTGDTRYAPKFELMEGSLWSQMDKTAWSKLFGRIGCDRFGRFYAVIEPQCVPEASRSWATVMTLTKKDWGGKIEIKRAAQRKLAMLSTSGWKVDASGAVSVLYSLAMGHIHAQNGDTEIIDQLLAASQSQFNELAGLYMGWKNNELEFDITLAQNNRMVDLWPNQFLDITLAAGDTPRGIGYVGNLVPREITLQPDPDSGSWSTEIFCEAETFAELAVNGDIPDTDIPPLPPIPPMPPFPPLPPPPPYYPPPTEPTTNHPKVVVGASSDFGVFWTDKFDQSGNDVIWKFMNEGLTETEKTQIGNLVVTPSGGLYILCEGQYGWYAASSGAFQAFAKIKYAPSVGASWSDAFLATDYPGTTPRISALAVNPDSSDSVAAIAGQDYIAFGGLDTAKILIGSAGSFSQQGYAQFKYKKYNKGLAYFGGSWHALGHRPAGIGGSLSNPYRFRFSAGGGLQNGYDISGGSTLGDYFAVPLPDKVICWNNGELHYQWHFINFDGTGGAVDMGWQPANGPQGLAFSPTGTHGMGADDSTKIPYKTTDSGASWQTVSGVIPIGSDVWESCRDDFRWIFGGGIIVRLTMDQGASYVEKAGNLGYIAPLIDVTHLRFVSDV